MSQPQPATTPAPATEIIGIFEAARILGVSPAYVRKMGPALAPFRDHLNRRYYFRAWIERVAGERAARRAARMLRRGA